MANAWFIHMVHAYRAYPYLCSLFLTPLVNASLIDISHYYYT